MTNLAEQLVKQSHEILINDVRELMGGQLQVSHSRAAQILNLDVRKLQEEGDKGRIKYIARGKKKRIYNLGFLVEYMLTPFKGDSPCQSTSSETKMVRRREKNITSTSESTGVGFLAIREQHRRQKQSK